MRTKTISRWRKAALASAAAASLALPIRPLLAQEAQPAPATPENGQIPATNAPAAPAPDDGTTQQYTIQRGDTLWDLSQKFLQNPWYWPKIWSLNPTIENPHWIYPGQKLNIKGGTGGGPAQVEGPAGTAPGTEQAADQVNAGAPNANPDEAGAGAQTQLGVEGSPSEAAAASQVVTTSGRLAFRPPAVLSVKAPGLVSQTELDSAGTLDASFEEKGMISTLDTAYVRFKQDNNVRVGDRLTIFRTDGDLTDKKGKKLGTKTLTVGEAKVIGISDGVVVVQITSEREEVERGDRVRPWVDDSRRLAARPNTRAVDGTILMNVEDSATLLGTGQQVYIDKGKSDGVEEGNTFSVIRRGDGLGATSIDGVSYTQGAEGNAAERKFDPDEAVGLLMVIDARDHVSTAVVVRAIRELEAGDKIQMRAATGG